MKSLVIIEQRKNYYNMREIYVEMINNLFKNKMYEKVYVVFNNVNIDEYWCICIPIKDYTLASIQHAFYTEDFPFKNKSFLEKYLVKSFSEKDIVEIFSSGNNSKLTNYIESFFQNNKIQYKYIDEISISEGGKSIIN